MVPLMRRVEITLTRRRMMQFCGFSSNVGNKTGYKPLWISFREPLQRAIGLRLRLLRASLSGGFI